MPRISLVRGKAARVLSGTALMRRLGEPMVVGHWVQIGSSASAQGAREIAARLEKSGLKGFKSSAEASASIIIVGAADDATLTQTADLSERGKRRMLVMIEPGAAATPETAWKFVRAGADDAWSWDDLADPCGAVRERIERWARIDEVVNSPLVRDNLVGAGPAWRAALRRGVDAALFGDESVLVTGETGTGKELVARLIHTLGPSEKELVVVDCTTIVPELAGSELFGHERGAFTGADQARDGAFALGDGGTLFLDEVGELPTPLQAQLLRAVQEKTYKRVGGNTWRRTSFRLICATNRDLLKEVGAGRFRRDLYHRIAGVTCRTPSLRERTDDILALAAHFAKAATGRGVEFSEPVRAFLLARDYPGNVRDLRSLVQAMVRRHTGAGPLTVGDVPPEERPAPLDERAWDTSAFEESVRRALRSGVGLKEIGRAAEETAIRITLAETGSVRATASRLAITERALQLRNAARRERTNGDANGKKHHGVTEHADPRQA